MTLAALAALLAVVATACGVTADTTAATVDGRKVLISDVDALARDEAFFGPQPGGLPESRLPGDLARFALTFELERAGLHAELDRWGLTVSDADRSAATEALSDQDPVGWEQLAPRSRELLVDYSAAQQVLGDHFARLEPDDETLRTFYDAAPTLWAQTCVTVVSLEPDELDAATAELDAGTALEELADTVPTAELAVSSADQCVDDAQVVPDLREAFAAAPLDELAEPVVLDTSGVGLPTAFVFQVDERRVVPFDEAREQLTDILGALLQQGPMPWVRLLLVDAEINPRFGSGILQGPDGSIQVLPPDTPIVPTTIPDVVPFDDGGFEDFDFEDFDLEDLDLEGLDLEEFDLDAVAAG